MNLSELKKHLPQIAFGLFTVRLICMGATIGDAIALVSLVAIYGFMHFLEKGRVDQHEELSTEIENLKNAITSTRLAQNFSPVRKVADEQQQTKKRYF